jgi:hypothetical protein
MQALILLSWLLVGNLIFLSPRWRFKSGLLGLYYSQIMDARKSRNIICHRLTVQEDGDDSLTMLDGVGGMLFVDVVKANNEET